MSAPGFLFDMDGVVCLNMPAHEEAWRRFFRERGVELELREFREKTMGMPTREVLRYYFKRDVPPDEAAALAAVKEELYRALYLPERRPAEGLVDFLEAARADGARLGLGTGSKGDNVSFILDGLDLRARFDAVVDAGEVVRGKPDPETFLRLAGKLGVEPGDCVVFEDSLLGEEAARRAGMAVVAVTTSHAAAEFRSAALAVGDFRGLSPAAVRALRPAA
ncbi:MAG: beta-phosphoglucomutase family hydrolase [Elusimicrobia bacterium]|nr:beta-phosphoglucomutase family hydrolase [Elusimicrobiota bacterium]